MNKRIAILGATSHIAKGLIDNFCEDKANKLYLFARSTDRVKDFLISINCGGVCKVKPLAEFGKDQYDVIINCVGIGDPALLKDTGASILELTEAYDNLILNYLKNNKKSIYINFSSGAVYYANVNALDEACFYSIAKLNSEAKHRSYPGLKIMDLRVFAYFSRFIDLKSKYLITGIINSIRRGKVFKTGKNNIVRDYTGPQDLFSLVRCCIKKGSNGAYDVYSQKAVRKFDLLKSFHKEFGLNYDISEATSPASVTGAKEIYCSKNRKAKELGFKPKYDSLKLLIRETEDILGKRRG
jgi:nucleoside-diphosphate-sugar epimerase